MDDLDAERSFLCVDDEENLLKLLAAILHDAFGDVRIDMAQNGEEALTKCLEHVPTLLITGVAMPGMDGIQLINALRDRKIEMPILVFTGGYSAEDIEKKGIKLGERVRYLRKPGGQKEIIHKVKSLLEFKKERAKSY